MIIEYDAMPVASFWVTAIEYDDRTGLTDEEEQQLDSWLENLPEGSKFFQYSEDTEFTRDDISGLMADCIECKIFMEHSQI